MNDLSKKAKETIGYVIIGTCVVIICALVFSAMILKREASDPETLCPDIVDAHTIILLDKTDSFTQNQQRFIPNYVSKEKNRLKTFEKFSIFTLTENTETDPDPVFSKCNPGTGKNANKLYQNPRKIQIHFDSSFLKPLTDNMGQMLLNNTGSQTPILEMIRELSNRDDFDDSIPKRTLVIVSDLMHHTSQFSQYKNKSSYAYFSKKPYAYQIASNLNGVEVKIVYLLRDKLAYTQGKKHLAFWKDYFIDTGAVVTMVKNVR